MPTSLHPLSVRFARSCHPITERVRRTQAETDSFEGRGSRILPETAQRKVVARKLEPVLEKQSKPRSQEFSTLIPRNASNTLGTSPADRDAAHCLGSSPDDESTLPSHRDDLSQ